MNVLSPCVSCCVGLWLASAGALSAQAAVVTRPHDLRFLLAEEFPWVVGDRNMPGEGLRDTPATGSRLEGAVTAMTRDDVLALLGRAVGPAGNGRAAPLLTFESGLLFVTASEDEQQRLATWLEVCRQVFLEQVTFEMHLLPPTVLAGAKGRMLRDEVDSMLRAAGPHPVFTCSARVGGSAFLLSNQGTGYVRDFDVEVAQKSTIQDPKIDSILAGQAWRVTTGRCVDGRLAVAVAGQQSELVAAPRVMDLPHRDTRGKRQLSTVQLPALRYVRQGAVARLADGDALLFGSGESGGTVCCLRLRRPVAIAAPSGADWSWLATDDLTAPRQPVVSAHLRLPVPGDDAPMMRQGGPGMPLVLEPDSLLERLRAVPGIAQSEQVGSLPGNIVQVRGDEAVRKAAGELLRSLASTLVRDLTVEVRYGRLAPADATSAADGRLDPGELAGRLPGAWLTGTLLDDNFHGISLLQHSYVHDYEVEIAQESAVPNPVIGIVNTGISIAGRVLAASREQFRLFLEVSFAELAGDITTFDLKDEDLGPVELACMRDVTFEVSPVVDGKRWTLVYLAPLHGTSDHFAVVARVRE